MALSSEKNAASILAFDFNFCPIEDLKFEPWYVENGEHVTRLAKQSESTNILFRYNMAELMDLS